MSSRRTEISVIEIDELEEKRDEIFEKLSDSLVFEKRLIQRFYNFCTEYNDFEYDEMGINMEEADNILRKSYKIRDLFLSNIENEIICTFDDIDTEVFTKTLKMNMHIENYKYQVILQIKYDSFNLELTQG